MRLLNDQSDKKLDNVTIFLTREEAKQLTSYLNHLLNKSNDQHAHLSNDDFQKEITICLYDKKDLSHLHPRARKLI